MALKFSGAILVLLAVGACSSSGSSPGSSSSGPDISKLHPPPNIDLSLCASVSGASEQAQLTACGTCCEQGGFPEATIYANQCVCAKPLATNGPTVCAAEAATVDSCSSCCTNAGFNGYGWVGGSSAACGCSGKSDATSCASTLSASVPDQACRDCCLNLGYPSDLYVGFGTTECRCSGG